MKNIIIENNIRNLDKIAGFIEEFGNDHNLNQKTCFELNLILDELVTNTIQYGYADDKIHLIDISIRKEQDKIFIQVTDDGIEFNPIEKKDTNINTPLQDKTVGGLGIYFVKQKVDELTYTRQDGKNVLSLIKKLI